MWKCLESFKHMPVNVLFYALCHLEHGNYQMGRQDDVGVKRIVFETKQIRVHSSILVFTNSVTQGAFLDPSWVSFFFICLEENGRLWELNLSPV